MLHLRPDAAECTAKDEEQIFRVDDFAVGADFHPLNETEKGVLRPAGVSVPLFAASGSQLVHFIIKITPCAR